MTRPIPTETLPHGRSDRVPHHLRRVRRSRARDGVAGAGRRACATRPVPHPDAATRGADRRRHTARGDQARADHPRDACERVVAPDRHLDRAAPPDGQGDLRARGHRDGRHAVGRRPARAQRARLLGHAPLRGLRHGVVRDPAGERRDRGRRLGTLPGGRPRPRRHELGDGRGPGSVPPAHPGDARRGRTAHRRPQPHALPRGAQPPADLLHGLRSPRPHRAQHGAARPRERVGRPDLRHRQHRNRRAPLGFRASGLLRGSGPAGDLRRRRARGRRDRASPRELGQRPRPHRAGGGSAGARARRRAIRRPVAPEPARAPEAGRPAAPPAERAAHRAAELRPVRESYSDAATS